MDVSGKRMQISKKKVIAASCYSYSYTGFCTVSEQASDLIFS